MENKYERKKARFMNHVGDMPTHPDLHPSHMLSKDLKGQRSYGAHKSLP